MWCLYVLKWIPIVTDRGIQQSICKEGLRRLTRLDVWQVPHDNPYNMSRLVSTWHPTHCFPFKCMNALPSSTTAVWSMWEHMVIWCWLPLSTPNKNSTRESLWPATIYHEVVTTASGRYVDEVCCWFCMCVTLELAHTLLNDLPNAVSQVPNWQRQEQSLVGLARKYTLLLMHSDLFMIYGGISNELLSNAASLASQQAETWQHWAPNAKIDGPFDIWSFKHCHYALTTNLMPERFVLYIKKDMKASM